MFTWALGLWASGQVLQRGEWHKKPAAQKDSGYVDD